MCSIHIKLLSIGCDPGPARYSAPLLVITGLFNPAIFNPPWISVNLFGYEPGAIVQFALAELPDPIGKSLVIFEGIGISVTSERFEIFATSVDDDYLLKIEDLVKKVFALLPHTPFGAMGINFQYGITEPNDELIELFPSPEGFEQHYKIKDRSYSIGLDMGVGRTLNISRTLFGDMCALKFNDHHDDVNPGTIGDILTGRIRQSLDQASKILEDMYQITEAKVVAFEFQSKPGGE